MQFNGNLFVPRNKYGSKKIVIDGITFASIKEGDRYVELKRMESCGMVTNIILQPTFELQPAFTKNGVKYRAIKYRADFDYMLDKERVIEDSKGVKTKEFLLKEKMFHYRYPELMLLVQ